MWFGDDENDGEGDARVVVVATILLRRRRRERPVRTTARATCFRRGRREGEEERRRRRKRGRREIRNAAKRCDDSDRWFTNARQLSVRVNAWVRERREHREEGEEKGGEVYAFVENDSEALMYFAAMSKETRGGATESLYDDVSFATMTGVGFDSDDEEEEKNSAEDGKRVQAKRC